MSWGRRMSHTSASPPMQALRTVLRWKRACMNSKSGRAASWRRYFSPKGPARVIHQSCRERTRRPALSHRTRRQRIKGKAKVPLMTRWLRPACVLLAFLGLAAAPALGQTLYAITGQTNQLITINTATGAGTLVGVIPIPGIQVGLGFRGANLYSWDETALRLRQLDPATAAIISTIDIGSNAFGEGDVTFRADGIGFIAGVSAPPRLYRFDISVPSSLLVGVLNPSMDGLAFNAAGVLFGLKEGGDQLYTID